MPTCIKMEWQLTISPLDPSISKTPGDVSFENKEGEAAKLFFFLFFWDRVVFFFFVFSLSKIIRKKLSLGCERVEDPNIFGFPFVWVGMPQMQ